jgi:hypothetical protein
MASKRIIRAAVNGVSRAMLLVTSACLFVTGASKTAKADVQRSQRFVTVPITTMEAPPDWAVWERHVLDQLYPAAREFVAKYTRPDASVWQGKGRRGPCWAVADVRSWRKR